MTTRLVVSGDRKWRDRDYVFERLDEIHKLYGITRVAEGCAPGLDRIVGWPCPNMPGAAWDRDDTYFTHKINHRHRDGNVFAHEREQYEACREPKVYFPRGWAHQRHIEHAHYPADWKHLKGAAGTLRNESMLLIENPDIVVAFHVDLAHSKGTRHMVSLARAANIDTYIFPHHGD